MPKQLDPAAPPAAPENREHQATVPAGRERARAAVREVAEAWGAHWEEESGRLALPLAAGLRRGRLSGRLTVRGEGGGARLVLVEDSRAYRLHGSAVAVLLIAGGGAATTLLWPFFPALLPIAGIGAVLALAAWFLVITRLATNGPEDFLAMVVESAQAAAAGEE